MEPLLHLKMFMLIHYSMFYFFFLVAKSMFSIIFSLFHYKKDTSEDVSSHLRFTATGGLGRFAQGSCPLQTQTVSVLHRGDSIEQTELTTEGADAHTANLRQVGDGDILQVALLQQHHTGLDPRMIGAIRIQQSPRCKHQGKKPVGQLLAAKHRRAVF